MTVKYFFFSRIIQTPPDSYFALCSCGHPIPHGWIYFYTGCKIGPIRTKEQGIEALSSVQVLHISNEAEYEELKEQIEKSFGALIN